MKLAQTVFLSLMLAAVVTPAFAKDNHNRDARDEKQENAAKELVEIEEKE